MALGLPQWLPLTDAENMIATHLAAEVDALAEDELMEGEICKVPRPGVMSGLNGNGRIPAPEMELDLDCWQVCSFGPNLSHKGRHTQPIDHIMFRHAM